MGIKNIFRRILKRPCMFKNHIFSENNIGKRDKNMVIEWRCSVCDVCFEFNYGLQALNIGRIIK
jgi:hypothetical protein